MTVETDLLARICAELEQRMTELRPLLDEYERLLEVADTLASIEAAPVAGPPPEPPSRPAPSRRRARERSETARRGSAAGAIELVASAPEPLTPAPAPAPAPSARRTPRLLPTTPTLRTQPMLSAPSMPSAQPVSAQPASPVEAPPPAIQEPAVEEFEPEPERKPASPGDVRQAIIAALEHGSHTIGELVMVTAMSTPEIRTNLSQLARQRKVTRVKREGDGKSAFALPASSTQG
jgi:hypothetical protein